MAGIKGAVRYHGDRLRTGPWLAAKLVQDMLGQRHEVRGAPTRTSSAQVV